MRSRVTPKRHLLRRGRDLWVCEDTFCHRRRLYMVSFCFVADFRVVSDVFWQILAGAARHMRGEKRWVRRRLKALRFDTSEISIVFWIWECRRSYWVIIKMKYLNLNREKIGYRIMSVKIVCKLCLGEQSGRKNMMTSLIIVVNYIRNWIE